MKPSIETRPFGTLPDGEIVPAWLLIGTGGMRLECIGYGGIVTRLLVPDRRGELADVVLGFETLESYLEGSAYFGAIVGRVAGRIPGARYCLDGRTYALTANDGPNHLHGGHRGYDKKSWRGTVVRRNDGAPSLRLEWISPHLDEGHPGTVHVGVTYTITHGNTFLIETEACTDRPTPFSLTHHSCFNLAGESHGTITDHDLQIHSDQCVAVDDRMTPLGRVEDLVGNGNDFRNLKNLGSSIPHLFKRHGDLYRLRPAAEASPMDTMMQAARLVHRGSGRVMVVSTTAPWLQLYTASELDEPVPGKSGKRYGRHAGVCLECEGYPDGISHPELGSILLSPGHTKRESTAYAFSNLAEEGTIAAAGGNQS
jgi:aldose 1-epimerase